MTSVFLSLIMGFGLFSEVTFVFCVTLSPQKAVGTGTFSHMLDRLPTPDAIVANEGLLEITYPNQLVVSIFFNFQPYLGR